MKIVLLLLLLLLGVLTTSSVGAADLGLGPLGSEANAGAGIGDYINRIYTWSLGVGAVLAVGMIVWGGIYISVSGAIDKQGEGKSMVTNAILGLVLLFGSFLILNTVNPQIVALSDPGAGDDRFRPLTALAVACPDLASIPPPAVAGTISPGDASQYCVGGERPSEATNYCWLAYAQPGYNCLLKCLLPECQRGQSSSGGTCVEVCRPDQQDGEDGCEICVPPKPPKPQCPNVAFTDCPYQDWIYCESSATGEFLNVPNAQAADYCSSPYIAILSEHPGADTVLQCTIASGASFSNIRYTFCRSSASGEKRFRQYPYYRKGESLNNHVCRKWVTQTLTNPTEVANGTEERIWDTNKENLKRWKPCPVPQV
jgi:hypothetical protein